MTLGPQPLFGYPSCEGRWATCGSRSASSRRAELHRCSRQRQLEFEPGDVERIVSSRAPPTCERFEQDQSVAASVALRVRWPRRRAPGEPSDTSARRRFRSTSMSTPTLALGPDGPCLTLLVTSSLRRSSAVARSLIRHSFRDHTQSLFVRHAGRWSPPAATYEARHLPRRQTGRALWRGRGRRPRATDLPLEDALQPVHLYFERGSPKAEKPCCHGGSPVR
jgi:hypothetical protein